MKNKIRAYMQILLLIVGYLLFVFVGFPYLVASFYYSIRLYHIGNVREYEVSETKLQIIGGSKSIQMWYEVSLKNEKFEIEVEQYLGKKLKKGNKIFVLSSNKLGMSNYVPDKSPTLWYVLTHSDKNGPELFIIWCFVAAVTLIVLIKLMRDVVLKIFHETQTKSKPDSTKLELIALHLKAFIPLTSLLIFMYVFVIIAIKALFLVEDSNLILASNIITYSLLLTLFSPYLISSLLSFLKSTKNKIIRNFRVIIATVISLFFTFKSFAFLVDVDFSKSENMQKVGLDLVKYIFTV